jgi:hypothetical protein
MSSCDCHRKNCRKQLAFEEIVTSTPIKMPKNKLVENEEQATQDWLSTSESPASPEPEEREEKNFLPTTNLCAPENRSNLEDDPDAKKLVYNTHNQQESEIKIDFENWLKEICSYRNSHNRC